MGTTLTPYFLAIGANLAFGTASIIFSKFTRSHSPMWVNRIKVIIGLAGFAIAFLLLESWVTLPPSGYAFLISSGIVGLCLGDFFLFKAFATLGATRTLVLYSFQPIMLGIYGYLFLTQTINLPQFFAILCMMGCVLTFLLERNRTTGKWDLLSFGSAFLGIFFDALGVMLSRSAYELTPALGSFQANGLRAFGAVVAFILIRPVAYPEIWHDLKRLSKHNRNLIILACILGTFISLSLYLRALKTAHVATLTSIAITGPVWVSLIEHIREKELPNRYLVLAFILFFSGFVLLAIANT